MRGVVKLLALLAVLLLPFGMAPAAATVTHHQMASLPMQHCPEQGTGHQWKFSFAECTMACSAALPAESRPDALPVTIIRVTVARVAAHSLIGIHPETAKPPPRLG